MTTTHAQHRTDERAASTVRVDRIAERLRELVEPRTTSEPSWVREHAGPCPPAPVAPRTDYAERLRLLTPEHRGIPTCTRCGFALRDGGGQRLVQRAHIVEHAPLLEQLHTAVVGSTAGTAGSSGPGSRPTANLEALDAWTAVHQGVRFWISAITNRPTAGEVEQVVRDLIARLPTLDRDDVRDIDRDVLRWWARARIVTTWDTAPLKPHVPCMNCDVRGKLRIHTDPLLAACLACGAAWDATTIGILGEHVRIMLADPIPDEPAVRADAIPTTSSPAH
ncbi:DUF7341 domain-containing protein [Cellulomonas gilvus]|uniref:DUF7341 domain-containing protein n=1 Tax=Cellulomonas gilvus (strain ATCC 13127 / NRRL B-14078) TaxID=593907 RepID=F8A2H4_CELGA|nr:hypothetical protein [Cellulomonas gilvus]AEI11831.1 hypothetical protein Celgi_1312 [Cellulomonas gilvus ATCC 13127]